VRREYRRGGISLAPADERLIVGTAEGVLLIYEVKEKPGVDGTATLATTRWLFSA
jgi:hypothetical protein